MTRRQRISQALCCPAAQDEEAGASDEDDEDVAAGGAALSAAELAGMRVRHSAEELGEGETMVMTLADRPIMDARGELADDADELENALVVRPEPGVMPHGARPGPCNLSYSNADSITSALEVLRAICQESRDCLRAGAPPPFGNVHALLWFTESLSA